MPTLSVIIVAHDSRPALAATLPALAAQLRDDDQLIVVDNASTDGGAEAVARAGSGRDRDRDRVQPRVRRRLQPRRRRGHRRAALPAQPRRRPAAGLARRDRGAGGRRPRMGGLAGAGHRRRRAHDQHRGRRPALHRDRLGGRGRRAATTRTATERRATSTSPPSSRAPAWRSPPRSTAGSAACPSPSSSTTRTSTSRCGCGSAAARSGSSGAPGSITTTSSTRARPSGATSSATAGRP